MIPKPEDVLVKGAPVVGLCHFLEKELPANAREAIWRQLPEPYPNRFASSSILASDRVPLSVVNFVTTLAARAKGEAVELFAERAGTFGAKEGTSAVFRSFYRVLSMGTVLETAPLVWSRIYSAGKMRVETKDKGATLRVADFPGDPAVCGRATGWCRYVGGLCGARNIRSRHECTSKGNPECVWEFEWD
jgi:hypothetical protein